MAPTAIAQHRPARSRRRKRGRATALDMFSGVGGSSEGIEAAGVDVWYAANHWDYAVEVHERNHPRAEHFIADLVDSDASDYYHPEQLPPADMLWASPSCTNHSKSNALRAYRRNLSLFDVHDEEYEAQVTSSERSRATAVCVLQYARKHHPRVIVVENVVEFVQWGAQVGDSRKGDGSTFRWWLKELHLLGYETKILYLNSMFFGVPQSRDRVYIACWQKGMRAPDLEFMPSAPCPRCQSIVQAVQTWKRRTAAWPMPEWGKYSDQYVYTCPSCAKPVDPFAMPAAYAIDWSDLGQRIGDKTRPLADSTMERIRRGVEKYFNNGRVPAVVTQGMVIAPMLHTARGSHEGRAAELDGVGSPMSTVSAGGNHHFLLSALFAKQNGGPTDTAWHQASVDPFNTLLTTDTTCLLAPPDLPRVEVDDCLYRMLKPSEIQAGMGIRPTFEMWGPARQRVRGLGNAVTPPVAEWICKRMVAVL